MHANDVLLCIILIMCPLNNFDVPTIVQNDMAATEMCCTARFQLAVTTYVTNSNARGNLDTFVAKTRP